MKANVGNVDRVVRIVLGLALLSLFFLGEGNLKWLGLVGVVLVATALLRYCPLNHMLGINTCSSAEKWKG